MLTLNLQSPVSEAMLDSIHSGLMYVQFSSALTDAEYRAVADRLMPFPHIRLRAYGSYDGTITSLDFLRHFPLLRSFEADVHDSLVSIDGLAYLPDDTLYIGLGPTKKRLSLSPLSRFRHLRSLRLDGQNTDIEVVGQLGDLQSVQLRSVTLPDLSLLKPLRSLRVLGLYFGGTKNLSLLPEFSALRFLDLLRVKGLSDLSPVGGINNLEYLRLDGLRQVEALPPMEGLVGLQRLWIDTMRGLTELTPIRDAPLLHHLGVVNMTHLQPSAFEPLVGHPTLKTLTCGLGSQDRDRTVRKILGLPDGGDWRRPTDL